MSITIVARKNSLFVSLKFIKNREHVFQINSVTIELTKILQMLSSKTTRNNIHTNKQHLKQQQQQKRVVI